MHRPVSEWGAGGTALTSLMDVERRAGKNKPVIKKALVELDSKPFQAFAAKRDHWALHDWCARHLTLDLPPLFPLFSRSTIRAGAPGLLQGKARPLPLSDPSPSSHRP